MIGCRRYVAHLDGTSGSSRLFKILPLGSLVLKQESRWLQWCARHPSLSLLLMSHP